MSSLLRRGRTEHGLRRALDHAAEVCRCLRRRVAVCADPRHYAQAEKIVREVTGRQWPELTGNDGEDATEDGQSQETSFCHASLAATLRLT